VLLFHTCRGRHPEHESRWARRLTAEGWSVLAVDSLSARHGDPSQVCTGNSLWGNERAADVQVSIQHARTLPFVDPERIAVIGFSHGGWAVLDALTLSSPLQRPNGLTELPSRVLAGLRAAIVMYPYCGFPAAHRAGWEQRVPVLALLAGADRLTDSAACQAAFARVAERGVPVETVSFPAASHAFDHPVPDNDFVRYDADLTRRAEDLAVTFLTRHFQGRNEF
jgi:dienelactone hydrolase